MTHRCRCVHHEHWRYPRKPLWIIYGTFGCLSAQFGNCNHTLLLWNCYLRFPLFALLLYVSIPLHMIVALKPWSASYLKNLSDRQVTCRFFCGVFSDPSFPIVSMASCPFIYWFASHCFISWASLTVSSLLCEFFEDKALSCLSFIPEKLAEHLVPTGNWKDDSLAAFLVLRSHFLFSRVLSSCYWQIEAKLEPRFSLLAFILHSRSHWSPSLWNVWLTLSFSSTTWQGHHLCVHPTGFFTWVLIFVVIPGLAVCGVTVVSQAPVASQRLSQRSRLNQGFPDVLAPRSCSNREWGQQRAFCVPSGSPNSNWPPFLCLHL